MHNRYIFIALFTILCNAPCVASIQPLDIYHKILQTRNPHLVLEILNDVKIDQVATDSLRSYFYYYRGTAYGQLGQLDTCLYYVDLARTTIPAGIYPEIEIQLLRAEGNVYWAQDLYNLSLAKYQQALALSVDIGQVEFQISVLGNIAGVYNKLNDLKLAYDYIRRANELSLTSGVIRSRNYLKQGVYATKLGRYPEAREALDLAITTSTEQDDSIALLASHSAKGRLWLEKNKLDKAEDAFRQSQFISDLVNYPNAELMHNLAELYMKRGQLATAMRTLQKGFDIAKETTDDYVLLDLYEMASRVKRKQGSWREAFSYAEMQHQLFDSLQSNAMQNRVYELEIEFETVQKQAEIERLNAENDQRTKERNALLIGIIMFAILAFTVTFFVWKNAKLKNALLSAELTELRVRISGILEGDPEKLGMSVNQLNKKLNVPLTHREFEVLKLALSEKSNGEIASETFVSVNTVKTHLKNIYEKLGVSNRKEALSFVVSDRG